VFGGILGGLIYIIGSLIFYLIPVIGEEISTELVKDIMLVVLGIVVGGLLVGRN